MKNKEIPHSITEVKLKINIYKRRNHKKKNKIHFQTIYTIGKVSPLKLKKSKRDHKNKRHKVNRGETVHNKISMTLETQIKREEKNQEISHFTPITKLLERKNYIRKRLFLKGHS